MANLRELNVAIDFDDIDFRKLTRVDDELDEIERELRKLDNTLQDASSEFDLFSANASDATRNLSRMGLKAGGLTSALSGAVAAAAPLAVAVGGLGASFMAAGMAAGAFGLVATGALTNVFDKAAEVDKIQEKIDSADSVKERVAAQKELAALYGDMSKEQQSAVQKLQIFKSFWSDFVGEFEKPIFETFGTSLQFAMRLLNRLKPTIQNTADVVNELMTGLNQSLDGSGAKDFFEWLAVNGAEALRNFSTIAGNVISGVWKMFAAFSPIGAEMEEGLIRITQRFEDWAGKLSGSKGFQAFIEYAREQGPKLMSILGNVGNVIKNLVVALAPVGSVVLDVLQAVTGFASKFSDASMEMVGFKDEAIDAFGKVKAFAQPAIDYLAKFFGDKIKEIRKFWETDGAQIAEAAEILFNRMKAAGEIALPILLGVVKFVWSSIEGVIDGTLKFIMGGIRMFTGLITGDFSKFWQGVKQMFAGGIEAAWNLINLMFIGRIIRGIGGFVKLLGTTLKGGWDNMVGGIKGFVGRADEWFTTMKTNIKTKFDEIVTAAKELPGKIGGGIRNAIADATGAMKDLADGLITKFKEALGIKSPSRVFMEMGGHVISGLVKGLSGGNLKDLGKRVFADFGGGIFDTWDMIKGFLTGDMAVNYQVGGGVQQWAGLATKALQMTGQFSESNLKRMLMQMSTESTGNPKAINLWDSNAKKGTPSKGLMQVIDPTFKSYAMPGFNTNIWDPLSNMLASIRYSLSRYGSLSKAWRGVGYAKGTNGPLRNSQWAMVGEEGPELVKLNRGSEVFSNRDSKRIASSDGAPVFNIYVSGGGDGKTIAKEVRKEMEKFWAKMNLAT